MKAPPIDKIFAIYGINLKTETAYFFKKNDSPNPVTSLCLDPDGKIPNYKCEGGIAFETKDTRQNCLKGKKRSGDGTVPYASLSFCKHWNGQNGCKVKIAEIEGAEHRAILRNKTFTQLVRTFLHSLSLSLALALSTHVPISTQIIETACQLPPPTDLPNTFSDCTWDAMLEVRGRDEPCVIQALTKEIVIQQKSGKKTKQRFAYTQVADLLVDDTGDSLTIEFEKAAQPFIFKAADATAIVDELASRCRFITLMETSNEEQRDEYGRTELHLAVIEGDLARVRVSFSFSFSFSPSRAFPFAVCDLEAHATRARLGIGDPSTELAKTHSHQRHRQYRLDAVALRGLTWKSRSRRAAA